MAWFWPFSSARDGGYTDAITAAVEAMAAAGPVPSPAATAAAEACAGLIARSLALATVHPQNAITAAVSPAWLRRLGYDLVRSGEHLAVIEVDRTGRARLVPATTWTMHGGRPWTALVNVPAPDGSATRTVTEAGAVSIVWAENELQPWRGRSPLSGASLTSGLLAAAHRSLGAEQSQPTGALMPVPKSTDAEAANLRAELARSGRLTMVESTASGWGQGRDDAPKGDWAQRRIGADPPAASVHLQDSAAKQVVAACGVPLELLTDVPAASRREAYRQFVSTTVEALGEIIAEELSAKLEILNLTLSFERLHASDMAGRARAVGSLVKAGWSPQEAADTVGLERPAATEAPAAADVAPMADGAA